MKILTQEELTKALFSHPYARSPGYFAGMAVVHLSPDKRMMIGYWHAPEGEVHIPYGEMVEHIQLLEGEVELCAAGEAPLRAKGGDIIRCGGDGKEVVFRILAYVKALFIVYPQSDEEAQQVLDMVQRAEGLRFVPK